MNLVRTIVRKFYNEDAVKKHVAISYLTWIRTIKNNMFGVVISDCVSVKKTVINVVSSGKKSKDNITVKIKDFDKIQDKLDEAIKTINIYKNKFEEKIGSPLS